MNIQKLLISISLSFVPIFIQAQSRPLEYGKKIIQDRDTIMTPNGIQDHFEVYIGGARQSVYVRGYDAINPAILFVHGGPASPMSPVMWIFQKPWEEYFTVIHYDQRASGRTHRANDTTEISNSIKIDRYVQDLIELSELLKTKYRKEKIILMGHSWGTILCMKAALQRPDLYYAYVGIGQEINVKQNEALSFQYARQQAVKHKNEKALKDLRSIEPYPGNQPITRSRIVIARTWAQHYGGLSAYRSNSNYFFQAPLLSPEYSTEDVKAIDAGNLFTLGKILPEFLEVDFTNIQSFPIPVFMFMGRHDYTTPSRPTESWINKVSAPMKKAIWFEHSAHLIPLEEPGKCLMMLVELIRPVINR